MSRTSHENDPFPFSDSKVVFELGLVDTEVHRESIKIYMKYR